MAFVQGQGTDPANDSAGAGVWDLMGWGALGWRGDDGPASLSARSRVCLGWADVAEPHQADEEMRLPDVGQAGQVYRLPAGVDQCFLLEYRTPASTWYDRHAPAGGLLI